MIWLVTKTNPYQPQPFLYLGLFYLIAFTLSFSFAAVIGFFLRRRFGVRELAALHFTVSVRQAALIAVTAVASLVLQSFRLFSWINMGLLLLALIFLEFFFITNQKNSSETNRHE